jgi:small subunit ribosomal protein S6
MPYLYESIFITDTNTPQEDVDAFVDKLKKIIVNYGPEEKFAVDRMGKHRLAYEIDKRQYGYYVSIEFEATGEVVAPLEEEYRLSDEILRFLTYRISTAQLKQRAKKIKQKAKAEESSSPKSEKKEGEE